MKEWLCLISAVSTVTASDVLTKIMPTRSTPVFLKWWEIKWRQIEGESRNNKSLTSLTRFSFTYVFGSYFLYSLYLLSRCSITINIWAFFMTSCFLPLFFVRVRLKSKSVGLWKGKSVGGPSSRGLEKQYLSYIYRSKIIIMAEKGRKCKKISLKTNSISNIFKPQTCTREFQIAESEEQIKETKIREENLNWNKRTEREIMDEKARQYRRD